jgi:YesN/AraC family two-component response regulator
MKRHKYFKKLFLSFSVLILVYTIIITTILIYKKNEFIELELNSSHEGFLQQSKEKIDTKLKIAYNAINELKYDRELVEYGRANSIDYYNITKIYEVLRKHLTAFSELGYSISITKPSKDIVITPNYTIDYNRFLQELGINYEEDLKLIDFFKENKSSNAIYFLHSDEQAISSNDNVITIVKREYTMDNEEILFFITFHEKVLMPPINETSRGIFAIVMDGKIITTTGDNSENYIDAAIKGNLLSKLDKDDKLYTVADNGSYRIHFVGSDIFTGWKYIFITPKNTLFNTISRFTSSGYGINFMLLIIGFIIAFFVTKKMYKPISDIVNVLRKYRDEYETDEMKFIGDVTSDMQKTNENLVETINSTKEFLKEKFLKELLAGTHSYEVINSSIAKYDLKYMEDALRVIILELENYKQIEDNFSKETVFAIKTSIQLTIKEKFIAEIISETFELDYKRYAIILCETEMSKIKKIISTINLSLEQNFQIRITAAIGKKIDGVLEIEESYKDALNLLELKFALDKKVIITYEEVQYDNNENCYYPLELERTLLNHIMRGEIKYVNEILDSLLDKNLRERKLGKEAFCEFKYAVLTTINRVFQLLNKPHKDFLEDKHKYYKSIDTCENKAELETLIREVFNIIVIKINDKSRALDNNIVDKMRAFIEQYYNMDISLEDVAENLNLSSGYISTVFKNSTGENFKDYLNLYRVEKAKVILKGENIKINDLAVMVGCNNVGTFIRMFKRYEGISPGEYSKSINP